MAPGNRKFPTRSTASESLYSLTEFMQEFPNDDTCLEWLWVARYSPDGAHAFCPKCEQERTFTKYDTTQQRQSWTCQGCGYHLHPTAGTIFHKSSTSLHLWFYAMYLMTSTRCGISAKQLERELGVTYKTAWRMAHLIRHELMEQGDEPLSGTVEADEMYVGGADKNRHASKRTGKPGRGSNGKVPVFGMVQRHGEVRAMTVPNAQQATIMPNITERVIPASTVYTDEFVAYNPLEKAGYKHERVNHAEKVYVSGDVHTNTIEGFWSLTKRGIGGVYHSVSARHLQGYLNEYAWRYNHRNNGRSQFLTLIVRAARP